LSFIIIIIIIIIITGELTEAVCSRYQIQHCLDNTDFKILPQLERFDTYCRL